MQGLNLGGRAGIRLLCIGAHSDDIEIGCGGLILSLLERRPVDVEWVVFSASGVREVEARRSAQAFLKGARSANVVVKAFRDGFFPYDADIKSQFEALKKRGSRQPDLILTHYRHDRHQDHRVLSDLAWNTFRDHWILEYEIPKFDGDLGVPNCFAPIPKSTARRKAILLNRMFGTQRDKHWFTDETFMGLMRLRGMECRSETGYAEAFYARKTVLQL
jgi:LmbE family N-acetylglucosaminyl deacetylase